MSKSECICRPFWFASLSYSACSAAVSLVMTVFKPGIWFRHGFEFNHLELSGRWTFNSNWEKVTPEGLVRSQGRGDHEHPAIEKSQRTGAQSQSRWSHLMNLVHPCSLSDSGFQNGSVQQSISLSHFLSQKNSQIQVRTGLYVGDLYKSISPWC